MINQSTLPILTSLLDTDAYKLRMQQAVYHRYPHVNVTAELYCRNGDQLGKYADQLIHQVHLMSELALTETEYQYLSTLSVFQTDYLDWLRTFRLRPQQLAISNINDQLHIRITGPWHEVILWEVPLLAVLSEIVHRQRSPNINEETAIQHLQAKLDHLHAQSADLTMSRFNVTDFGTRRRFSKAVHRAIVTTLKEQFPYFTGTSNYALAQELDLTPIGTQAHEWFQAHQQITPILAESQKMALQTWQDEYPHCPGIALTDCISMDAFLRDFDFSFASRYQGLRHDSGDPITWGEKAIQHYTKMGIDPLSKTLVFSDNLDLAKALFLYRHFHRRIQLNFGIGTRLTCDIPGVDPLNIVIKLVECNNRPVAKLSDNPAKTICLDFSFIEELQKAFALPPIQSAN